MSEQPKFLKCIRNGRVFPYTATLATRDDMVPCNSEGKITIGYAGDAQSGEDTMSRRITKFLGNVKNGRLFPYTPILAERDDLVSIESEEQWKRMLNPDDMPENIEAVEGISLNRGDTGSTGATVIENKGDEPKVETTDNVVDIDSANAADDKVKASSQLPNIEGMSNKDAKSVLDTWAKSKGHDIDRRKQLNTLIEECNAIAGGAS